MKRLIVNIGCLAWVIFPTCFVLLFGDINRQPQCDKIITVLIFLGIFVASAYVSRFCSNIYWKSWIEEKQKKSDDPELTRRICLWAINNSSDDF